MYEHCKQRGASRYERKITLADQIYADIKKTSQINNWSPAKNQYQRTGKTIWRQRHACKTGIAASGRGKTGGQHPKQRHERTHIDAHELNDTFDIRLMMDTFFIKDIITTLNYNSNLRQQLLENMENRNSSLPATIPPWTQKVISAGSGISRAVSDCLRQSESCRSPQNLQPFTFSAGTYFNQPHYRDCECVEEHQAILDAALAADPEGLRKAIETHISNSRRAFQLIFKVNQMV